MLHSRSQLAAENLFVRKQLALYLERQLKPRRADDTTRIKHFRSILGVIFVPMGLSALGAILLWLFPPAGAPRWLLISALVLQAVLFLSLLYWVPLQLRIQREGNRPALMHELIHVHWTRVANLTLYAVVVLWLAWLRLQA